VADFQHQEEQLMAKEETGGNLEQVREILFGAHQRDQSSRFSQIEASVSRQAAESAENLEAVRRDLSDRIDQLADRLSAQMDTLSTRLDEGLAALRRDQDTEQRQIADQVTEAERKLRESLDAIERQANERVASLRANLNMVADRLDHRKVDGSNA
tara:strand:+ start:1784 stop:2251 length:468 start_codon:yes stop_codon:yes gene_type:complete